jgi:hypothetical protein
MTVYMVVYTSPSLAKECQVSLANPLKHTAYTRNIISNRSQVYISFASFDQWTPDIQNIYITHMHLYSIAACLEQSHRALDVMLCHQTYFCAK